MSTTTTKQSRKEARKFYVADAKEFQYNYKDSGLSAPGLENLREKESLYSEQLIENIKNQGGVVEPIFVYSSKYNVNGKMLVGEGSRRVYSLQEVLAKDPDYTGHFDVIYQVIPDHVAENEIENVKFILNFSIDKRVSPNEQWQGIKRLLDIYQEEVEVEIANGTLNGSKSNARNIAVKRVAEGLGKTDDAIFALKRVYEDKKNDLLIQLIENEQIAPYYADVLLAKAASCNIDVKTFIDECLQTAMNKAKEVNSKRRNKDKKEDNELNGKITRKTIDAVVEFFKGTASIKADLESLGVLDTTPDEKIKAMVANDFKVPDSAKDKYPDVVEVPEKAKSETDNPLNKWNQIIKDNGATNETPVTNQPDVATSQEVIEAVEVPVVTNREELLDEFNFSLETVMETISNLIADDEKINTIDSARMANIIQLAKTLEANLKKI